MASDTHKPPQAINIQQNHRHIGPPMHLKEQGAHAVMANYLRKPSPSLPAHLPSTT